MSGVNAVLRTSAGLTWLVLVAATMLSWWLGADHGLDNADAAAALLIAVPLGKVYLIGMQFMELRHADPRLCRAFQAYCAVAAAGLIGMLVVL